MKNGPYVIVVSEISNNTNWKSLGKTALQAANQWKKSRLYGLNTLRDGLAGDPWAVKAAILELLRDIAPGVNKIVCLIHRTELLPIFHPFGSSSQARLLTSKVKEWAKDHPELANYTNVELWYFSKAGGTIAEALSGSSGDLYADLLKATTFCSVPAAAVLKHQVGKIILPADVYLQGVMATIANPVSGQAKATVDLKDALKNTTSILSCMCADAAKILNSYHNACTNLAKADRALGKMAKLVKQIKPHCREQSLKKLKKILQPVGKEKDGTSFHECFLQLMRALDAVEWK